MPQAVASDSLLYADDACIVFQYKSEIEIEKQLIRDFSNVCDWFVDKKSSMHFGLRRLLCNALIQPLFDYACTAWFPNLSKKLRLRLQATQNKCIRFCLQLDKMSRICVNEFLELNWLNVHDRYLQFIVSDIFKFYNNQCPDYFNEVFCPVYDNGVATHCCKKKVETTFL